MLRALILMIALLPCAVQSGTRPATGLLTKNGPLPATIPLQIRTNAGRDFAVVLTNDDEPVISGYIRGGEFFRLLVPPGDHNVIIVTGQPDEWQGPEPRFGANAPQVTLPLSFHIADGSRRQGHQITLKIQDGGLKITGQKDQVICQIARWENVNRATPLRELDLRLTTRSRFCD